MGKLKEGDKIPDIEIGTIRTTGELAPVKMSALFGAGRNVLIGIPGAFTPVCTRRHLPDVIANATSIRARDIEQIYCISDDNPWALEAWQKQVDPDGEIQFLSDGNREFLNATQLINYQRDHFIANHYARFFAVIDRMQITRLRIEATPLDVTCTTGSEARTAGKTDAQ